MTAKRLPTQDEYKHITQLQRKAQIAAQEANMALEALALDCDAPPGARLGFDGKAVVWVDPNGQPFPAPAAGRKK